MLAATLPRRFDAHHWRAVWDNFDVFLLAAFLATAWTRPSRAAARHPRGAE